MHYICTLKTAASLVGAATNNDDALGEALATVRIGDAEPILIRDAPPSGDDERDRANLAAFLTQLYRDVSGDPLAMLPTIEPPAR